MVWLCALAAFGLSAQQDRLVTLDMAAMTLDKAAEVLSNATGERYVATPTIKSEVLLISVKDVPASVLRAKIAKTLNAYIEQKDGVWYIGKSPQQLKDEAEFDENLKKDRIDRMIRKAKARLEKAQPFDTRLAQSLLSELQLLSKTNVRDDDTTFWTRVKAVEDQGIGRRMMNRLISRIKPEMFAKMQPGALRVFSNRPTAMQYGLDFRAEDILSMYSTERNTWASVAKGASLPNPQDPGGVMYSIGSLAEKTDALEAEPKTLLLKSMITWTDSLSLELYIADAKGEIIDVARHTTTSDEIEDMQAAAEKAPEKRKPVAPLELSSMAKRYATWLYPQIFRVQEAERVKAMEPVFLQPQQRDPLSYHATEVLMDNAKKRGKQLIAYVPDAHLSTTVFDDVESAVFGRKFSVERIEDGNWIYYAPINKDKERRDRMNREDLGQMVREFARKSKLTIEQEAALTTSLPDPEEGRRPMTALLNAAKGEQRLLQNDYRTLRLIGSLSPSERKAAAANPNGIPVRQLNAKAVALLNKYIFLSQNPRLDFRTETVNGRVVNQAQWENFYNGLRREPTVSLANGIPPAATLKIFDTAEEVVKVGYPKDSGYYGQERFFTAEELAAMMVAKASPEANSWANSPSSKFSTTDMSLYQRRKLRLEINLTGGMQMSKSASQVDLTSDGKFSLSSLPAGFKASYEKAYKEQSERGRAGG